MAGMETGQMINLVESVSIFWLTRGMTSKMHIIQSYHIHMSYLM